MTWEFNVDGSSEIGCDIILGIDLLTDLVLDLMFFVYVIAVG